MKILVHEWVTGGGLAGKALPPSLAREGGAIRRAVVADFLGVDGVDVVMTLDERFAGEPTAANVILVRSGEEESRLLELAGECDHTVLIAPETGGVLAERTRSLEAAGRSILGSSSDAVFLASDKLRLAGHLDALEIATPLTRRFVWPDAPGYPHLYPAVVKPIDGAGAEDTFLVLRRQDLANLPNVSTERIIQEYRVGEPMSASFLVSEKGEAHLLATGWQTIVRRDGRLCYEGGRLPGRPDLVRGEPLSAVWSVPGLRGFVGVDFVWDEASESADVIEINPRVTTSYVGLSHYFGLGNVAKAWLGVVRDDLPRKAVRDLLSRPTCRSVTFLPDGTIDE